MLTALDPSLLARVLSRALRRGGDFADVFLSLIHIYVNALTGYVQTRRHGRVSFAIIVNDRRADDGPVERGIDRALDLLARS